MTHYPQISSYLAEFAEEMGYEILIEPEYSYVGRIKTKTGKILFYHTTRFDINGLGASEIAKDKTFASYFMEKLGYPVPEGDSFYSDYWAQVVKSDKDTKAAVKYAEKLGFPLIVKPNSESQGRGVAKVHNVGELRSAIATIFNEFKERVVIVQKVAPGQDYRIVVLEDEVICAYRRTPLAIIGDGQHTIEELLKAKQAEFVARGRDTTLAIDDPRIQRSLFRLQATLDTVPESGKTIELLANANLSSGGDAEDVTPLLQEDYKKMAIQLTRDMGLRFCGIDIMTENPIDEPMSDYTIIEINSAPGLDYYAETGDKQKEIVKNLYRKLIQYLIQ